MISCLIVEDNPLNWMVMQNQAVTLGLQVTVCTNGREALEHCRANRLPDLVLLDGSMPEMNGMTFLKQMRELPEGARPYVVFCSSSLDHHEVGIALNVGAECHFPKPITRDQIIYALKQVQNRFNKLQYQPNATFTTQSTANQQPR